MTPETTRRDLIIVTSLAQLDNILKKLQLIFPFKAFQSGNPAQKDARFGYRYPPEKKKSKKSPFQAQETRVIHLIWSRIAVIAKTSKVLEDRDD